MSNDNSISLVGQLVATGRRTSPALVVLSRMTMLKRLCPKGRYLSLVSFCLLSVRPLLSAQTGKVLIADTCYNEVHQREHNTFWASQVKRRTAGHLYLEEEIETIDGPIHRLISVDGHEPSPSERKQDDAQLHDLAQSPKARLTLKKKPRRG